MNVAVQLDPKVYNQAQRDPVFTPIKEEINPPEEKEQETKPSHLSNEEKKLLEQLGKVEKEEKKSPWEKFKSLFQTK